jgi:hypothetical protein
MSEAHALLLVENKDGRPSQEPVHAERLPSGALRVVSSPGFVQGIAAGDEFRLLDGNGAFEVTHRAGNVAVQLFSSSPVAPYVSALSARVQELGGWLDGSIERGLVFTLPITAGFPAIERLFQTWVAEQPGWEWAFGNVYAEDGSPFNWWQGRSA